MPRPWLPALVLVTGVGPLATDTYLAALPQVRTDLASTAATVQLTMTTFIAGMAVGQVLSGPVSDARGRRRLIVAGAVVFAVTSLLCVLAPSGPVLVLERLAQGLAAGVGVSVGRAVVTDTFDAGRASAVYGTLASTSLLGPVVAPGLGTLLLTWGSWRVVFWFLAGLGVVMTVLALLGIPETLPAERRQPAGWREVGRRTRDLLGDARFLAPVVVQCAVVAGFFVYIGGSSLVLQQQYGIGPGRYALLFATNAVAMVTASLVFRLLVVRTGAAYLRRLSMTVAVSAGTALFVVCLVAPGHRPPLAVVWVLLAGMLAGLGCFLPSSTVLVQAAGRRSAGTAAALGGGIPFLVGASTTPLTGLIGAQTVLSMSAATFSFYVVAVVAARRFRHLTPDDRPVPARDAATRDPRTRQELDLVDC